MPSLQPDRGATPTVEAVGPERLEALAPEWGHLWRRCPSATPFESPEWLVPWARQHAPGRTAAVALRYGGVLEALVPVFCWRGCLLLAGTGPSDHAGALVQSGAEGSAPLLLEALPDIAPEAFDAIDLQQLPPTSALLHPLPSGWREERGTGDACFVASLHGPEGLGALSGRRRKNWRHAFRRLEREGGAVSLACGDEVAPAMRDLFHLHALRWKARGKPGVLADPLLRGFLLDAAPRLDRAGMLRLWQVRLGHERVAVLMVLAGARAQHYYIGGFDPAQARLSPSAVLIGAAMAGAHREGATRFDFLRGDEPYKRDWSVEPRPTCRRILISPS